MDICEGKVMEVGNSTDYLRLTQFLEQSLDLRADPCEDFYQFACGNFILSSRGQSYSVTNNSLRQLLEEEKAMLESKELQTSQAITASGLFFEKCLSSEKEWGDKGGSINFVMQNIRKYGNFPLIDGPLWQEEAFDLTGLLVHFNKNRTLNFLLVPHIAHSFSNISEAVILFQPDKTRVLTLFRSYRKPELLKRLLKLTQRICNDTNSICENTAITHDLEDVYTFMEELVQITKKFVLRKGQSPNITTLSALENHVTSVNWTRYLYQTSPQNIHQLIVPELEVSYSKWEHLQSVDRLLNNTSKRVITNYVNWTRYLYQTSPQNIHQLIVPELEVSYSKWEHLQSVDRLLNNTSKRVITNYVILVYILSWIDYLHEDYLHILGDQTSRETVCYRKTVDLYEDLLIAKFARLHNGKDQTSRETVCYRKTVELYEDLLIAKFARLHNGKVGIVTDYKILIILLQVM
ncbi:hypothetical protein Y032_0751g2050 [Ancylostoma ceylanicum]|uniref:Peptidase M13 N-terminal domain-containing protein n=1 Tax=Ancylostoma ceylanicum TaxID=53326 RepID=A0A016WDU9_9BILA|nr:hypothetical protein Y032_0751g2050 [Ancylostoma ceylanicum]